MRRTMTAERKIHRAFRADITIAEWLERDSGLAPFRMPAVGRAVLADLHAQARVLAAERRKRVRKITAFDDLRIAGSTVRKIAIGLHGLRPFPEKTSLSVEKTGTVSSVYGYHIEKIIFQSRPEFYVTANVYVPLLSSPPYPAIIFNLGHAPIGKAYPRFQHYAAELAINGILVLCMDPVGQGERDEYVNYSNASRTIQRACRAHGIAGDPMYLTGASLGGIRLWDSMRGIDYLESRNDVDVARIGAAGMSGGGWESLWLSSIDRRIVAVHSGAYSTTMLRRMENRGEDIEPDPEQDAFGFLSSGLDIADIIMASAPAAVSLSILRKDFFPVDGALAIVKEVSGVYRRCGIPNQVTSRVFPGGHGGSHLGRVRYCVQSLMHAFGIKNRQRKIADFIPESEVSLATTASQCINGDRDGVTSAELNARVAVDLAERRSRNSCTSTTVRRKLRRLLCIRGIRRGPARKIPKTAQGSTIVVDEFFNTDISQYVPSGDNVIRLSPACLGWQEAKHKHQFILPAQSWLSYDAFLVGRCLPGIRVEIILGEVERVHRMNPGKITMVGIGQGALLALFAACIDHRIDHCIEVEGVDSLHSICVHREYRFGVEGIVPGILRHFDLDDIRSAIYPRKLSVFSQRNHRGDRAMLRQIRDGSFRKPL